MHLPPSLISHIQPPLSRSQSTTSRLTHHQSASLKTTVRGMMVHWPDSFIPSTSHTLPRTLCQTNEHLQHSSMRRASCQRHLHNFFESLWSRCLERSFWSRKWKDYIVQCLGDRRSDLYMWSSKPTLLHGCWLEISWASHLVLILINFHFLQIFKWHGSQKTHPQRKQHDMTWHDEPSSKKATCRLSFKQSRHRTHNTHDSNTSRSMSKR